jgi:hypothetical protein
MALIKLAKEGYGQLELNFAAFRRNGAIEAQCKMADGIEYLENGMLLVVDRATRTVYLPGTEVNGAKVEGPIALNYTTEHTYDEREKGLKNFKLDKNTFLPRLGYIGVADKFTTNTVCYAEGTNPADYKYGKVCETEGFQGYIELTNTREDAHVMVIDANTTMPDGQKAVKFAGLN